MDDVETPRSALRLLFAGGGSGGSATPLLAVAQEVRRLRPEAELLYVGTVEGPERSLVERQAIPFVAVQAGKLRRYLSVQNLIDPVRVLAGIGQAMRVVGSFRPHVGFGAGGFASVPPLVACRLLRVPIVVHQQDVEPSLANRLLAPLATEVSVSLAASLRHFPSGKVTLNGNPVRATVLAADRSDGIRHFGLEPEVPTLLITGGGTGALGINRLVAEASPELVEFCQIIHLSGRGRQVQARTNSPRYHAYEFLVDEMPLALAAADLVISRAGMATITELSVLGKPTIVIPMPRSHQLANARALEELGGALVLDQEHLTAGELARVVRQVLADSIRLEQMGATLQRAMPGDAARRLAGRLVAVAGEQRTSSMLPPSRLD